LFGDGDDGPDDGDGTMNDGNGADDVDDESVDDLDGDELDQPPDEDMQFRNPKRPSPESDSNPLVTQEDIDLRYSLRVENVTTGPEYDDDIGMFNWNENMFIEDVLKPANEPNWTSYTETINFAADSIESIQNVSRAYERSQKGKPSFGTIHENMAVMDAIVPMAEAAFSSSLGQYMTDVFPLLEHAVYITTVLASIQTALLTPGGRYIVQAARTYFTYRNDLRRLAGHPEHRIVFDDHLLTDWLAQGDIGYGGNSGSGAFSGEDSYGPFWSTDREVAFFLRENKFHIDLLHPWKMQFIVDPGTGNSVVGFRGVTSQGTSDINFYSSGTSDGVDGVRLPRLYNDHPTQQLTYNSGHFIQSDIYLFSGAQIIEIECTHPGVYPNSALVSYRTTSAWDGGVRELGSELLEFGDFDTSIEITDLRIYNTTKIYCFELF
jgi:hypothetical protein